MQTDDKAGVDSLVENVLTAFNTKNAEGFAALFAPDATFVDVFGRRMVGHDVIEEQHRYAYAVPLADAILTVDDRHDTELESGVVVVDLSWRHALGRGGDGRVVEERVGLLTLTAALREGQWQIVLGHNVDYTNAFTMATDVPGSLGPSAVVEAPGRAIGGGGETP